MEQELCLNLLPNHHYDSEDEIDELCTLERDTEEKILTGYTIPNDHPDDDRSFVQLAQLLQTRTALPLDGDNFKPLFMDPGLCIPINKPNIWSLRNRNAYTPIGIFTKRFFPQHILQTIALNTNMYAKQKSAGEGRPWEEVTDLELQCFFEICLYMGVFRCPQVKDYWDKSLHTPKFPFISAMFLLRFEQIKRYVHVCDPHSDNGRSYFFSKREPLFSHFVSTSKQLWIPSTFMSVDEMMVMCHGRSSETVRMRNKLISCGFKLWSICDSGYVFFCFPHSNKNPWRETSAYKGKLTHSSSVVARLCEDLPRRFGNQEGKGKTIYALFMDNFLQRHDFSSSLEKRRLALVALYVLMQKAFPSS